VIEKIMLWMLGPQRKTELEEAIDSILSVQRISSASSSFNPVSGGFFIIGDIDRYNRVYPLCIEFSSKDKHVAIKRIIGGDVVYYFNDEEDVRAVRDAIITRCNHPMK